MNNDNEGKNTNTKKNTISNDNKNRLESKKTNEIETLKNEFLMFSFPDANLLKMIKPTGILAPSITCPFRQSE